MSPSEKPVPPVGEEIHLPGPSLQPLLLTVGITVALVGVTTSLVLVIAGGILALVVLVRWIQDARRELDSLPVESKHH
jgi:hypothetical protein